MKWESKIASANQMLSCLCLFKIPLSWIALPAMLLLFASYPLMGFGFLPVLYTSLVGVLSSILYTVSSNQKAVAVDELVEERVLSSVEESSDHWEDAAPNPVLQEETLIEAKEGPEEVKEGFVKYSTKSPDLPSENECQEMSTSEESEVDWPFQYMVDQSPDYSEGSISDEEFLIEISLPSGHYVGQQQKEDQPKFNCSLRQKKELSADCLFGTTPQSLMEFLAEYNDMNEEENLIEIDISMGSIKYSRFEIETSI